MATTLHNANTIARQTGASRPTVDRVINVLRIEPDYVVGDSKCYTTRKATRIAREAMRRKSNGRGRKPATAKGGE